MVRGESGRRGAALGSVLRPSMGRVTYRIVCCTVLACGIFPANGNAQLYEEVNAALGTLLSPPDGSIFTFEMTRTTMPVEGITDSVIRERVEQAVQSQRRALEGSDLPKQEIQRLIQVRAEQMEKLQKQRRDGFSEKLSGKVLTLGKLRKVTVTAEEWDGENTFVFDGERGIELFAARPSHLEALYGTAKVKVPVTATISSFSFPTLANFVTPLAWSDKLLQHMSMLAEQGEEINVRETVTDDPSVRTIELGESSGQIILTSTTTEEGRLGRLMKVELFGSDGIISERIVFDEYLDVDSEKPIPGKFTRELFSTQGELVSTEAYLVKTYECDSTLSPEDFRLVLDPGVVVRDIRNAGGGNPIVYPLPDLSSGDIVAGILDDDLSGAEKQDLLNARVREVANVFRPRASAVPRQVGRAKWLVIATGAFLALGAGLLAGRRVRRSKRTQNLG